jgi:DNA mismatch repair ATPase MutL
MRFTHLVSTSALCSLLATTALIYGQEQREEPKRAPEPTPEATQPAQDEMKAPRQEEAKPEKQNENKKGEDKASKQENTNTKDAKQNDAARSGQHEQRAANQRGGHIPDDKFRASFGRQHKFAIQRTTVNGQPGFQYGGYSFVIVDAWPVAWAYTDDCYVDYVDGEYFLFDLLHPGVQVALVVVL